MATVCLVSRVSKSNKRWVTHGSVSWQQYVLWPETAEATRGGSHTAQSHGNSMSCVQRLQKQQEVGHTRLSLMATVCLVSRVSRSNKRWVTHGSVSWQQYVLCPELAEATRGGSHTAQSHGNSMSCVQRLQKQQEVGHTRLSLMATVCLVSRVSRSNKSWVTHGSVSWQQYVLCPELAEATRGG